MTRVEFIKKYYPLVKTLGEKTGIFPEIIFAQAIIESSNKDGFGENYNAKHGNNFFGIRPGTKWSGATIENPDVKTESKIFRAYNSIEESIQDYFRFLINNKRYREAGVFTADNYKEQMKAIANAGYAGKGNEEKYFALLSKVGSTVKDVLGKGKEFIEEHKTATGATGLILLAGLALIFSSGKK